jgi:hypothetical protein
MNDMISTHQHASVDKASRVLPHTEGAEVATINPLAQLLYQLILYI